MRDPEDDPRLKELLRQVEAVDIPDYPDWKKGRRWGLTAGVAAAADTAEIVTVAVKRGTQPPPHRRGGAGVIIGYFAVTSFVIIILHLIILFIAICIASGTEHFIFSQ